MAADGFLIPEVFGEVLAERVSGFRRSPCCGAAFGVDTTVDLLACSRCGMLVPALESPVWVALRGVAG